MKYKILLRKMVLLFFIISMVALSLFTIGCSGNNSSHAVFPEQYVTIVDSYEEYMDLGLPSGTKWKKSNEEDPSDVEYAFYTYEDAVEQFGHNLPRPEQWLELINECQWVWNGYGYKVTGSNGNSIVLPASGLRSLGVDVDCIGKTGYYWTSACSSLQRAWYIRIKDDAGIIAAMRNYDREIDPKKKYGVYLDTSIRDYGFSVRLVQD